MGSESNEPGQGLRDAALEERAANVRRRFKIARLNALGRSFWEHWHPETSALLVVMYSIVVLLFLEPALWSDAWPADVLKIRIPDRLAVGLLFTLPFNGWLLDRFLSSKTPGEHALPSWLLGLRLLSSSLPIIGMHAISWWREVLERGAKARVSRSQLNLREGQLGMPVGIRGRLLYTSGFFFLWIAVSFIPPLVWAVWLVQTEWLGSWHRPVIYTVCAILHLVNGICMAQYVRSQLRNSLVQGWRRALLRVAPYPLLFGLPGMLVGFSCFVIGDASKRSLAGLVHDSRTGVSRDPLWKAIQGGLRSRWRSQPWFAQWRRPAGLARLESGGRVQTEVIAFYRLKTLLLPLDGAAFLGALYFVSRGLSDGTRLLNLAIRWSMFSALVLAGIGLVAQTLGILARLLRISRIEETLRQHPYCRYLLLTQTALLAGIYGFVLVSVGQIPQFGLLLAVSSGLCATTAVIFFMPTAASPDMMLWGSLFFCLCAFGGLVGFEADGSQESLTVLKILTTLTPLWSLGLFFAQGDWLLRPFTWRDVFDSRTPRRLRWVLGGLVLTTALPLGGVAVLFWIYARHRVLPRYALRTLTPEPPRAEPPAAPGS